ncbi:MAG: 2-hydroxyacyl-CoA dehydratase [Deltaproteobacteria bacterium]|nr:2-hydroxyacyl-CoA dehydratase [Deltaproteobacteria bacterium]
MDVLTEFYEILNDPYAYGQTCRDEKKKKVIGYFCSYTPEEIISAAGAHPMRLFGTRGEIALADQHLQAYSCSLVRGALEEVLNGRLDFLDGTVFPHTCDSIQRLSDVWRLNTNFRFFADIVLPVKLDTDSAKEYMVDVLRKFKRDLKKGLNCRISDEDLNEAIATYNKIRDHLKVIYGLRSKNPGIITGGDVYSIVKVSMIMDRNDLVKKLPELIENLKTRNVSEDRRDRKRVALVGSICDQPDIYSIIEKSGGVVVWDDLCTGSRYFEGIIEIDGDPIVSIAKRYIERQICPAKHVSLTARGDHLVAMANEHDIQGFIFLLLKFCEPHAFDYPYMKEYLEKENIPSMLLEIEDQLPAEGQLLTRFETFMHMF